MIQAIPTDRYRGVRHTASVAVMSVGLLGPISGMAQTAEPAAKPSVGHALAKGVTLKVGQTATLAAIYLAGTGSLMDAGALTAIGAVGSYGIYVVNEYLWDFVSPNPAVSAGKQSFDVSASLWRNTGKYLTYKPAVAAFSWGMVYAYTGSVSAMLAMGSAASLSLPLLFYVNNVAWDWYDWRTTQVPVAK